MKSNSKWSFWLTVRVRPTPRASLSDPYFACDLIIGRIARTCVMCAWLGASVSLCWAHAWDVQNGWTDRYVIWWKLTLFAKWLTLGPMWSSTDRGTWGFDRRDQIQMSAEVAQVQLQVQQRCGLLPNNFGHLFFFSQTTWRLNANRQTRKISTWHCLR